MVRRLKRDDAGRTSLTSVYDDHVPPYEILSRARPCTTGGQELDTEGRAGRNVAEAARNVHYTIKQAAKQHEGMRYQVAR